MKRVAAIDLGTNTFLCLIAEVEGQNLKVIKDMAKVVRLGEKVNENKSFLPAALARADECLKIFENEIKTQKVDYIVATATSAARDVKNGADLLALGRERNIPISIIPGYREAELSFEGAISTLPKASERNIFVVDVGGGSTELIYRKAKEKKIKGQSFDVGCVRLTEMFLRGDPVDQREYDSLYKFGFEKLREFGSSKPDIIIAVAGTPTTFAAVAQKIDFDESKVEGYTLTKGSIEKLVNELKAMPLNKRKSVRGLEPLRADVIVAGGALLLGALAITGLNEMRVSTRGLRYGTVLNYGDFI